MWPIRGGGNSPPWEWCHGLWPPWWPATPPPFPSGNSPTWEGEGGSTSPLAYIKRRAPLFNTQSHLIEISLSLSSSLLVWFPLFGADTRGWGFLHHTHAAALLESGSESIFFRCSAGSEPGGTSHTPYVCETTWCCTCGTPSSSGGLRREVFNTARRP